MVPLLHCLLLLWLGWGAAATAQEETERVVQATESETVIIPCILGPTRASNDLNLTWLGPRGTMLLHIQMEYKPELGASLDMDWGLLIHNISRQEDIDFTCSWEGNPGLSTALFGSPSVGSGSTGSLYDHIRSWFSSFLLVLLSDNKNPKEELEHDRGNSSSGDGLPSDDEKNPEEELEHNTGNSSGGYLDFFDFARDPASFPCIGSETSNTTRRALYWNQYDSTYNGTREVLKMLIWHAAPYRLGVNPGTIFLALPSVTSRDTGNYTCFWQNRSQHFQLEVSAKSAVWLNFGEKHWIIWSVALGYMFVCLGFLYCFVRLRHGFRARRQKKMRREPAMRKIFQGQRNRAPDLEGIVLTSVNRDGKEQVDAFPYENVLPGTSSRGGQQSPLKGNTLPAGSSMENEDNEEEYECPDEDNEEEYECPDSETEQKMDDEDNYENAQEEVKQEDVVLNDGSPYENSKKERCASDGDNYENVEEEPVLSPGAARLIAGLRLHLALEPQVDKQDGGSEASTGSQSYEEMNGTLSPTASKGLHTSNEEDADSYENMESPNSFSLRREGNMNSQGEGASFSSARQNLSIPFEADLKGDAESYENMAGPNSFSLRREGNMNSQGEGAAFGSVRQNPSIPFEADLKGDAESYENMAGPNSFSLRREGNMNSQGEDAESYENMAGPNSFSLQQKGNMNSQGEDAESYENMKGPNSFSLQQKGNMNSQGEGAAFGSVRQNLPVPFGADLKGGL